MPHRHAASSAVVEADAPTTSDTVTLESSQVVAQYQPVLSALQASFASAQVHNILPTYQPYPKGVSTMCHAISTAMWEPI